MHLILISGTNFATIVPLIYSRYIIFIYTYNIGPIYNICGCNGPIGPLIY